MLKYCFSIKKEITTSPKEESVMVSPRRIIAAAKPIQQEESVIIPKSKTMELSSSPQISPNHRPTNAVQQTRSRSSGPPSTTNLSLAPSTPNRLPQSSSSMLDKKSLDKFLKLASNSASLLDLNNQTSSVKEPSPPQNIGSNSRLKTSSSNLLSLCGMEKMGVVESSQPPTTPKHQPVIVSTSAAASSVAERPQPKPRVVLQQQQPANMLPNKSKQQIQHSTPTSRPISTNNASNKFDAQLDQLLSKQPPIIADAAVISTFRLVVRTTQIQYSMIFRAFTMRYNKLGYYLVLHNLRK